MRIFINKHPYIALAIAGMVCTAAVEVANLIIHRNDLDIIVVKEIKNAPEKVESVEE